MSHGNFGGKSIPGGGNSKYKGPGVGGVCLSYLGKNEVSVARADRGGESGIGQITSGLWRALQ